MYKMLSLNAVTQPQQSQIYESATKQVNFVILALLLDLVTKKLLQ